MCLDWKLHHEGNSLTYNQPFVSFCSVRLNWNYNFTALFTTATDVNNLCTPRDNNSLLCSVSPCIKRYVSNFIAGFSVVFAVLSVGLPFCLRLDYRLCLIYQNSKSSRSKLDSFSCLLPWICTRVNITRLLGCFWMCVFLEFVGCLRWRVARVSGGSMVDPCSNRAIMDPGKISPRGQ